MSDFVYSFERLRVSSDSRVLYKEVYETTRRFPRFELFGFTSPMNRRQLIALRSSQLRA
jgi:hypothetical protein